MLNILLIANQPRLQHIIAEAASLPGVALRVTTTLDVPQDIAAEPPQLLFLQNRLSGLSAEILSRHIRSQLSDDTHTAIIILSDSEGDAPEEVTIVTAVTDEQLASVITDIIIKTKTAAGNILPLPSEAPLTLPLEGEPATDSIPPEVHDTVMLGSGETSAPPSAGHLPPLKFQEELDCLIGTSSPAPSVETADTMFPVAGKTVDELLQHPSTSRIRPRRAIIGVVGVIAVATILFFSTKGSPPTSAPGKEATARKSAGNVVEGKTDGMPPTGVAESLSGRPTTAGSALPPSSSPVTGGKGIRRTELPKFIPREAFVKGYGETNPGWEQYVTPDLEFRIFRNGREIKALQAIDRTGNGMSRSFFTRAILEMAEVRDYRLLSKEVKGEYLVKKGTLSANAAVILYKKKDDTQLKAFVIHYQ